MFALQNLLTRLCGLLCAAALFAIMVLTFFDVGGRKLISQSIPGSLELTELLMVVVIFAGLPLVSQRGEHVLFDSLDGFWSAKFVRIQKIIVHILSGCLLLALAYLMWNHGLQFLENGETTAQLKVSKAPFIFGMSVLCGLTGLVHWMLCFQAEKGNSEIEGAAL